MAAAALPMPVVTTVHAPSKAVRWAAWLFTFWALLFTVAFWFSAMRAGRTFRMEQEPGQTLAEVVETEAGIRGRYLSYRFRTPGSDTWYYGDATLRDRKRHTDAVEAFAVATSTGRVPVCYWLRGPAVNSLADPAPRLTALDRMLHTGILGVLAVATWAYAIDRFREARKTRLS